MISSYLMLNPQWKPSFSKMLIDGRESIKKYGLEKHIKGEPSKRASDLKLKRSLGLSSYQDKNCCHNTNW